MHGLHRRGIEANLFVQRKLTDDPHVRAVASFKGRDRIGALIAKAEEKASLQSVLFPWSEWLRRDPVYAQANIVHLHIFHMEYLSLPLLPRLVGHRKLLVTMHDAWPITGHCVYPASCDGYRSGCHGCPKLDLPFPMRTDRAALMARMKHRALHHTQAHLHVTTEYMQGLCETGWVSQDLPCTKVPLGIDTEVFKPAAQVPDAPRALTVGIRASDNHWKGLPLALAAFREAAKHIPLHIVTFQGKGLVRDLGPNVQVTDLGWVTDEADIVRAYQHMDVFMMPSTHESFGYMALEAMACGVPPIIFETTTMEEVAGSAQCAYLAPYGQAQGLAQALIQAHTQSEDRLARGRAARVRASTCFPRQAYEDAMVKIYEGLLA
jgi:glycosyltransferase involved in cell wall biosynthesis